MSGEGNIGSSYRRINKQFTGRQYVREQGVNGKPGGLVLGIEESIKLNKTVIEVHARLYDEDPEVLEARLYADLVAESQDPQNIAYLQSLSNMHAQRMTQTAQQQSARANKNGSNGKPRRERRKRKRDPKEVGISDEEVGASPPEKDRDLEYLAEADPEYF